jgi:ribonuclease BN (tRNA processing enzyme)
MKLKVLGASGSEFPDFNSPAFLVDDVLLLDAGTIGTKLDEMAQWKIKHILLTHSHLDHIKGIPFLADNIILKKRKHSVTIMAIPDVLRPLRKNLLNNIIWPDFTTIPTTENPVLKVQRIREGRQFRVNTYNIVAHRVNHSVPATGYVLEARNGKRLLYTGDTGPTDKIWEETRKPIDCAIIEVSMPNSMNQMALLTGHLTASLLKKELKKMRSIPRQILITHPKPQHIARIKKELAKLKMNNIRLLKDGGEYRI